MKHGEIDAAIEAVGRLLEKRADSHEMFFSSTRGLAVETKKGETESFKVRSGFGVSLRTLSKGRPGFAYTTTLSPDSLSMLADAAVGGGRGAGVDKLLKFPAPRRAKHSAISRARLVDHAMDTMSEAEKIEISREIERSARSTDPRIKNVRKSSYSETFSSTRIVNSNGADFTHEATFYSGSITVVAEEKGESQTGWAIGMGHHASDVDAEAIGLDAAERAVGRLGGREIPSMRVPVVLDNFVAVELLESLEGSLLGDSVMKGKSMLAGKLGKKVFSDRVTIIDDGTMPGGWATSNVDGEGVLRKKTVLAEDGRLKAFLYDSYWAGRAGKRSTGNSSRGGFKSVPSIGISNLYIKKGRTPQAGLLKDMGRGLLITELMGVHTINPINGDFSLGAEGHMVEAGEISYPVRGIAIAGNLIDLFGRVERVGGDMRFLGSTGAPSLLLSELDVSGSGA
jgi:PmbA protein